MCERGMMLFWVAWCLCSGAKQCRVSTFKRPRCVYSVSSSIAKLSPCNKNNIQQYMCNDDSAVLTKLLDMCTIFHCRPFNCTPSPCMCVSATLSMVVPLGCSCEVNSFQINCKLRYSWGRT